MKPSIKPNFARLIGTSTAPVAFFLTTLAATSAITVLDDDLVLRDRDQLANPEDVSLYFTEDDFDTNSNALFSWQTELGAWVWGYGTNSWSMFLDQNHVLTLYNTDTTTGAENAASIILNPGDGILGLVPASITIEGDKVITEGNGVTLLPTLLANDFIPTAGSSNSLGSADSFLLEGTHGGSGSIPTSGAGTRMMWYPEKSSFRAGYVDGAQWDHANIGDYSVAMGYNTIASGDQSATWGVLNSVSGYAGTAWGLNNSVTGTCSTAWGNSNSATGMEASAWGNYNTVEGAAGTVWGFNNSVVGQMATAWGGNNTAQSAAVTVMGYSNIGGAVSSYSEFEWFEVDPLLEVANGGYDPSMPSNALTTLKNGQTTLTNKHWKAVAIAGGNVTADIVATSAQVPDENGSDVTDPNEYYSRGNALVVEGHAVMKGKVIIEQAQGDISMGAYE